VVVSPDPDQLRLHGDVDGEWNGSSAEGMVELIRIEHARPAV